MILKEAFRYQNFLSGLLDGVCAYLNDSRNIMEITQQHMRSAAHSEATDETTCNKDDRAINVPVDHVVNFGLEVLKEKEALAAAIDEGKKLCPSVDRGVAINKNRQRFIGTLKRMAMLRGKERMTIGNAYCFNAEGVQVPYRYDIKETSKIDFDRNNVKKIIEELTEKCDEASNFADYSLTAVKLEFTPQFSINDSFEDLIEKYHDSIIESAR